VRHVGQHRAGVADPQRRRTQAGRRARRQQHRRSSSLSGRREPARQRRAVSPGRPRAQLACPRCLR
jgi:hypothetical protein